MEVHLVKVIKLFLLLFFSFPVLAANITKQLRFYSDWLGINQPTLFCQCPQMGGLVQQRTCGAPLRAQAEKLIPHYIYPIELIAKKFPEYLKGDNKCFRGGKSFKGIDCVQVASEKFRTIETDAHNLTLIEPSLKSLIDTKLFNPEIKGKFLGACPLIYNDENINITSLYQGWIARVYLYLNSQYSYLNLLNIEEVNRLVTVSKNFPPTPQECRVTEHINRIQEKQNNLTKELCLQIQRKRK